MGEKRRYELIRDDIMADLLNRNFREGDFFSTDQELCLRYNAARNTVRHAVKQLEHSGFLECRRHVGILAGPRCGVSNNAAGKTHLMIMLPEWSYVYGNKFELILAPQMRSGEGLSRPYYISFLTAKDSEEFVFSPGCADAFFAVDPRPGVQLVNELKKISAAGYPVITIDAEISELNCARLHYRTCRRAVEHFYALGHRRIGMLCHFGGHIANWIWMKSFVSSMNEFNLPILPGALIDGNAFESYNYESLETVSAWICVNRRNLCHMLEACRKKNLKIPEDVSVIGSDEHEDPSLGIGNLHLDFAQTAVTLDHIINNYSPGVYDLDMVIDPRQSVAPPPQKKYRSVSE